MRILVFFRVLILLLSVVGLVMIIPLMLALAYGETHMIEPFLLPILGTVGLALVMIMFTRSLRIQFSAVDGALLVFFAWIFTSVIGALPYYFSGFFDSFTDCIFESVSGFTTTGSTILNDVEILPRSLLFWRGMTHWLGGMGIVVLTVALLPLLGIGGFQLLKAESPGPESDKVTPKITETAKILWIFYVALTALQTIFLVIGGIDWFDAIIHAFSTMGTGGFSTRNASVAAFQSPWMDWVCTIFMLLAGLNFTLYYRLLKGKYLDVIHNTEAKVYLVIVFAASIIAAINILPGESSFSDALRKGSFHVASIITTTGFAAANHNLWPPLAQGILFFLMFIGGCAGSTAGGIKVIRHVILFKQSGNELNRMLYKRGVFTIQLNKKPASKHIVYGVAGFVFFYMMLVLFTAMMTALSGADPFTSLNAALITVGNIGLGLGNVGPDFNFDQFPSYLKWVFSFAMIAGRLELWTVFVFFSREFWRR
jgi:trk system potassium uptake protein TrkH